MGERELGKRWGAKQNYQGGGGFEITKGVIEYEREQRVSWM